MNQVGQVFVFEESFDAVNSEKNGTLSLLKKLDDGVPVSGQDLNMLRKEFLKRLFTFYIVKLGAGQEEDAMNSGNEKNMQEESVPNLDPSVSEVQLSAARICTILDNLDAKLTFMLYH